LPELERKIIENLPFESNLYNGLLQEDEDIIKGVYDHGIKRRIESGNSHSPLLRKSQMKYLKNEMTNDEIERNINQNFALPQEDSNELSSNFFNHKGSVKSKICAIYFT